MMKKKTSDLENECKFYIEEVSSLKKKLKEMNDQNKSKTLSLSKSSENLLNFVNSAGQDKLKRYL